MSKADDENDDGHPFSRVSRACREGGGDAAADVQYEEGRLDYLLKALRLPKRVRYQLREKNERETGFTTLTFRCFNEEYPTFPILLGSTALEGIKLHLDPRAFLPQWFNNFTQLPFLPYYDAFCEAAAPRASGRSLGLVFRRNGVRHGLIVMNDEMDLLGMGVPAFVHPDAKSKRRLYVAAFQKVVEAVHNGGHGWKP